MKIESPLHAEHQLDQLAGQFEHWRQTRTHPSGSDIQVMLAGHCGPATHWQSTTLV